MAQNGPVRILKGLTYVHIHPLGYPMITLVGTLKCRAAKYASTSINYIVRTLTRMTTAVVDFIE